MIKRRTLGKREREARKRHRRGIAYSSASGWQPLKLGLKKFKVRFGKDLNAFISSCRGRRRKGQVKALESHRRVPAGEIPASPLSN